MVAFRFFSGRRRIRFESPNGTFLAETCGPSFGVRFFQATSHPFPTYLPHRTTPMREIKLQDLKSKTPAELVSFAEENGVENASTMRKQ
ncbi:hypothetical protein AC628_40425, partial [Bradyrhizobium sp. NAS96.2]